MHFTIELNELQFPTKPTSQLQAAAAMIFQLQQI